MNAPRVNRRAVLVTGCSSGIGRASALHLRDRGWRVIPTARKDRDLEKLRQEGFEAVRLDLADSESVARAAEEVLALCDRGMGGLVNNAGYGQIGAVEDLSRDALRRQFEVNVFGMQELTNRFLPKLREQGWGRIVNVSSVYGRVSAPTVGAYCASKHAMEALSDALRMELRGSGVAVSLIEPGAILSEFRWNAAKQAARSLDLKSSRFKERYTRALARKRREERPSLFTRPPEEVAKRIRHALESRRPRARYCITIPAHIAAFMRRAAPTSLLDRLLSASVRR